MGTGAEDMSTTQQFEALRAAAQAVIDRWETPLWKDVPATAEYIAALRDALEADHFEGKLDMVARWYMVTKDGAATLCVDREDAEHEAKINDAAWPNNGPHRAVQLVEVASVAASAGSEPVAWLVCTEEGDPDMVFLSQHEAQQYLEDDERPTPLYTHPSPPEGMVMVPKEPTEAMKAAAVKYANGSAVYKNVKADVLRIEEGIYGEVYEAMIAAAPPTTPASSGKGE